MLRLQDNPPIGFSATAGANALGPDDWAMPWWIAYSRPRQEKALAWDLLHRGITYFLPMVERETSSGGRRRRNLYPLFASYIFYAGGEAEHLSALRTERIVGHVSVTETQQPTLREELAQLELAVRLAPRSIELHARVERGARVTVRSGPLRGVEGIVLDATDKRKIWLGVSALGAGVTLQIPADLVEAQ